MESILLLIYTVILIYLITLLVISAKRKSKKYWIVEYLSGVLAIIYAVITMYYFKRLPLPQDDFYPWLEYLWEIVLSIGTALIYFIVFIISIVYGTTIYVKETIKNEEEIHN